MSHFWDVAEPKLLAMESRPLRRGSSGDDADNNANGSGGCEGSGGAGGDGAVKGDDEGKTGEETKGGDISPARGGGGGYYRDGDRGPVSPSRSLSNSAEAAEQLARLKDKAGEGASGGGGGHGDAARRDGEVATLFATSDHGVQLQGTVPVSGVLEALVGLSVPHLFFAARREDGGRGAPPGPFAAGPYLTPKALHDFVGLEDVDLPTRRALLDFACVFLFFHCDQCVGAGLIWWFMTCRLKMGG